MLYQQSLTFIYETNTQIKKIVTLLKSSEARLKLISYVIIEALTSIIFISLQSFLSVERISKHKLNKTST